MRVDHVRWHYRRGAQRTRKSSGWRSAKKCCIGRTSLRENDLVQRQTRPARPWFTWRPRGTHRVLNPLRHKMFPRVLLSSALRSENLYGSNSASGLSQATRLSAAKACGVRFLRTSDGARRAGVEDRLQLLWGAFGLLGRCLWLLARPPTTLQPPRPTRDVHLAPVASPPQPCLPPVVEIDSDGSNANHKPVFYARVASLKWRREKLKAK